MKLKVPGLNSKNLSSRNIRARRNHALKIILENRFKPEIRRYFKRIAKETALIFVDRGILLQSFAFTEATEDLLKKQYNRTSRAFKSEMRLYISKQQESSKITTKQTENERIDEVVNTALAIFIARSAVKRAPEIDSTTGSDIKDSYTQATTELQSEGKPVNNPSVAIVATTILLAKFAGRLNTLAITETQFMSESTKLVEASTVSRAGLIELISIGDGTITGDPSTKKEWAAILDQVTRSAHAVADGQVRNIDEPFNVMGERLKIPGDTSLGASAGNVINCRCSALYTL